MSSLPKKGANLHRLIALFFMYGLLCSHEVSALIISPPSSASDYRQLASLLVNTFDAPADLVSESGNSQQQQQQPSLKSKIDALQWYMFEKSLTEESTYKQYVSTARRMRGKKYCLLVAKECIIDEDDNQLRVKDDVVGMVEMGMSPCPVPLHQVESCSGSENNNDIEDSDVTNDSIGLRPQPTVGVLCVHRTHQQKGIGQALVQKCEEVAADIWGEQYTFVDVEPDNQNALGFFEKCGYDCSVDGSGGVQTRSATVSRRRATESRPHFLLQKRLARKMEEVELLLEDGTHA